MRPPDPLALSLHLQSPDASPSRRWPARVSAARWAGSAILPIEPKQLCVDGHDERACRHQACPNGGRHHEAGCAYRKIKPEHIGDAVHPGSDGTECAPLPRRHVISARPCSTISECACHCSSPCRSAARGADDVRPTPRYDRGIPCGSSRLTVLRTRFARVNAERRRAVSNADRLNVADKYLSDVERPFWREAVIHLAYDFAPSRL